MDRNDIVRARHWRKKQEDLAFFVADPEIFDQSARTFVYDEDGHELSREELIQGIRDSWKDEMIRIGYTKSEVEKLSKYV